MRQRVLIAAGLVAAVVIGVAGVTVGPRAVRWLRGEPGIENFDYEREMQKMRNEYRERLDRLELSKKFMAEQKARRGP